MSTYDAAIERQKAGVFCLLTLDFRIGEARRYLASPTELRGRRLLDRYAFSPGEGLDPAAVEELRCNGKPD